MKKWSLLIFACCLMIALILATPALAEEAHLGTIGETQASVNTEEGTTEASASAAASYTDEMSTLSEPARNESVSPASAQTASDPGSDSDGNHAEDAKIDIAEGSAISIEFSETSASGTYIEGAGEAQASEAVGSVAISAPEGSAYENLLEAEFSEGHSTAKVGYPEDAIPMDYYNVFTSNNETQTQVIPPHSYASSSHNIGIGESNSEDGHNSVSLFDGRIVFDEAGASAGAAVGADGTPSAYTYAYIANLQVWDPELAGYTTAGYSSPLYVSSSTWTLADINALVTALNGVLAKSNLSITSLLATSNMTVGPADPNGPHAQAEATAMEVLEYDEDGKLVAHLTICNDCAQATFTSADAEDVEAVVMIPAPEESKEQAKPTGEQVVETVQAQPAQAVSQTTKVESANESVLPYTGSDLFRLVFLGFGLIAAGIALSCKLS
jgi:hypothetical protein